MALIGLGRGIQNDGEGMTVAQRAAQAKAAQIAAAAAQAAAVRQAQTQQAAQQAAMLNQQPPVSPKPTPVATIIVNPPKTGYMTPAQAAAAREAGRAKDIDNINERKVGGDPSSRSPFPVAPAVKPVTGFPPAINNFLTNIQSFFQNLFKPALGQTYKTSQWDGLGKSRRKNLPPKTLGDLGYDTNQWDGVGTMSELERKG